MRIKQIPDSDYRNRYSLKVHYIVRTEKLKRNKKRHEAKNMKTKTKKQERVDGMVARVKAARESSDGVNFPCEAIARTALEGALNNRTAGLLANAPTFHKRPLGSLLHRLVRWNQSIGNLHGLFTVKWDCELLARFDDKKTTHGPMANDKRMIGALTGEQLFDELTSMAVLLCNGSQAANNWKRALGW